MTTVLRSKLTITLITGVLAACALAATMSGDEAKVPYRVTSVFVEGCSCAISCPCNTGKMTHGCQGVGALVFSSGSYKGVSVAGARVAYATAPENWVRLYVQAKDAKQQDAVTELAKKTLGAFGKVEDVKTAKIDLSGKDGKYVLSVDGGKIMQLETEPVLGADNKPEAHTNTVTPFSPTIYQGKTLKGSYSDGGHSFDLAGSNSFFNPHSRSSGSL